ncbi:MAG: DUF169 domain-containing protein [Dehalococcoidia bacterium]
MTFIDPNEIQPEEPDSYDWPALVAELNELLRLRVTPIGMKLFESVEEMEAVPRIRRPDAVYTTGQIVAQAARLNWTVGVTDEDLPGSQCGAVLGLHPQDEQWQTGASYAGVWYETPEDAAAHQQAMDVVPYGAYRAMAVSPLVSGRLDPPDICLFYATPGQMIIFINGLQWAGYQKFEWGIVGESACADSWGRALATGRPSLSIPCFAERRYGGVLDEEMLMAIPPRYLPKTIDGMQRLSRNGLRYPIPQYGIQTDARAGLGFSYG